jgi:hypothetical protein
VLVFLAVAFVPYAIFHLLFHEVVTVRYALPLAVPIAYLAASALEWAGTAVLVGGIVLLAVWSLAVSVPAAVTYGREGSPAFRALRSIERTAQRGEDDRGTGLPPVNAIGLHAVARRAAHWEGSALPAPVLTASHGREWLTLVKEWRSNPRAVIAFVADPRRTDLALIDPRSRRLVERYRWGFVEPPFVGGARPGNSDLYVMEPPGWMLDHGWALTAEIAGVTERHKFGPYRKPSVAWIRARAEKALLMIGGRHLGSADEPQVHISMSLNGHPLESRDVPAGFFFWLVPVPAGALAGAEPYVPLEVRSEAADGQGRQIAVALEQFDLQSAGTPMVGAEAGWQEPEYNPLNARSWRWTTERATLWVRPVGRDVTLALTGESPLRYYDTAPTVRVTVGGREAARFNPSSDFTQTIVLPSELLAASDGRVVIETDKWFVPGDRDGSPDRRHLGLRIYSFSAQ